MIWVAWRQFRTQALVTLGLLFAFTVLVLNIELAAATGAITAPEPREAAQQVWSAVHGSVTLELKGLMQVPEPEAAFRALVSTLLRGLA